MLNNYETLMGQASNKEINEGILVYKEAFSMLNQDKALKLSELTSEIKVVLDLLLVELKDEKVEKEDLVMGVFLSFKPIFENYQLIYNIVMERRKPIPDKERMLELQAILEQKVYDIKKSFKENFNYNIEEEQQKEKQEEEK